MNIKEKLYNNIENLKNEIENISEFVFEHAELGNEEYISSAYLVQKLKEYGFQVTYPYLDIPTAFRAEYKKGDGLKIAFLPEYDALPGYGETKDKNAHACGHNWIAATTLGAAIGLATLDENFNGTIVVIGTPA